MKLMKLAVAAVFAFAFGNAYAFHSGGVAECEGCHSMHNSFEGEANVTGAAGTYLLKASDQSGACLNCHGAGEKQNGYHVSTENVTATDGSYPQQLTPGGDFAWLKKNTTATVRGSQVPYAGERRGHNIIATDFGYDADSKLQVAPGGTYPAASLGCQSCHDPHGRYRRFADGNYATTGLPIFNSGSYNSSNDPIAGVAAVGAYRILGGTGYKPKSLTGSFAFTAQVPSAVAPSTYNQGETTKDKQVFVAYGQGMSEWCGNCHTAFVQSGYTSGMGNLRHPAGNNSKLTNVVTNYNSYVTSGIMTNQDVNAAYSTLTPFEVGTNDFTALKARAALNQAVDRSAAATNNVMCLSCHRAHASGFESMLRFGYLNEFMTIADSSNKAAYDTAKGGTTQGLTAAALQQAYYGRAATEFGPYARAQCNKCHAKD